MKPGFYISMGVAIAGLVAGFVLLNDVQQEKETVWIQKIPKQCNDVWEKEYNNFVQINPDMTNSKDELEMIILNHYENEGVKVLNVKLEKNVLDEIRCEACSCLGWDRLSLEIRKNDFEKIAQEGWSEIENPEN